MRTTRFTITVGSLLVALMLTVSPNFAAIKTGQVAAALQPFIDRHELAGAVTLVATKDSVIDVATVGFRDLEAKLPMTPDTLFWIASQTKPITATAMMMLVEEGKVNLDDPVEKYLPEFAGGRLLKVTGEPGHEKVIEAKPAQSMLVRHLLNHMSGLPFMTAIETKGGDRYPLAVRVQSYALQQLMAEPGEQLGYSNAGTNTAGRIIEVVSGMPYEQFLQERLFDPLGMTDTTFWPNQEQLSRLATCYRTVPAEEGHFKANPTSQLQRPLDDRKNRFSFPAGGLFSTAHDVAKFCQMILNDGELNGRRYVSASSIHEMTKDQTGKLAANYGLAWSVGSKPRLMGHGGADGTNMTIYPEKDLIVVWMVAGAQGTSQAAFNKIAVPPEEPKPDSDSLATDGTDNHR